MQMFDGKSKEADYWNAPADDLSRTVNDNMNAFNAMQRFVWGLNIYQIYKNTEFHFVAKYLIN